MSSKSEDSLAVRLAGELARGEDAQLSGLLQALGLVEDPPATHDAALIEGARTAADRSRAAASEIAAQLDRQEDADLGPTIEQLGLAESPPSELDAVVADAAQAHAAAREARIERQRAETRSERQRAETRSERRPQSMWRRFALTAAAASMVAWFRGAVQDHTFALIMAGTMACGIAVVVGAQYATRPAASVAPRAPPPVEDEGYRPLAVVTEPGVRVPNPRGPENFAFHSNEPAETTTATAGDRTIAEALAGPVGIGGLRDDGTLEVTRGIGIGASHQAPDARPPAGEAPPDVRIIQLVVDGAVAPAAGGDLHTQVRRNLQPTRRCYPDVHGRGRQSSKIRFAIDGDGRAHDVEVDAAEVADHCTKGVIERARWPRAIQKKTRITVELGF